MATISQQPVKPSALKDWRRFWQPLEHRTGCCDWAWKSTETQKATQEQYQPADKKILALTWDHYSIPLEWEPFKERNSDRRKPTFCHWVIDHLPTLISPSFSHLLNVLTAFRLQLVPLYQVIKRCFYMKTQQSKWDLGLYGSPICSALTFRPWKELLYWGICLVGVGWMAWVGGSDGGQEILLSRRVLGLLQRELSSKHWWVSQSVSMWGLCKFGPFVSFSNLDFRNTNLETRPSTCCSPCLERILLEQLLLLYDGLPRINPLPFEIWIGFTYGLLHGPKYEQPVRNHAEVCHFS